MNAVTPKEKNMLLVTVVIVLYAFAALSFKKQIQNWKVAQRVYATAQKEFLEEKALIAAREEWAARYEQVRELMPIFPRDKDVDTHWLNLMDSAATRNGLSIARRQTNKEVEVGDVYELPIDCKDWEGTLESLVKFLYDLNQEGAMLDVRQLYVRPSSKQGLLKGSFTLYCAYMRGKVEKQTASAKPVPSEKPAVVAEAPAATGNAESAPAPAPEQPASTNGATHSAAGPPPAAEKEKDR